MRALIRVRVGSHGFSTCVACIAALLVDNAAARAEDTLDPGLPPAPAVAPPPRTPAATIPGGRVPDPLFHAVINRRVTLAMRPGGEIRCYLLGEEGDTLVCGSIPGGEVLLINKGDVAAVRIDLAALDARPVRDGDGGNYERSAELEVPGKERHFGIHIGLSPALTIDYEHSYFYGFGSFNLVWPLLSVGESRLSVAMAFGAGVTFRASTRWKFDVFLAVTPNRFFQSRWDIGVGAGIGMHYTFPSGMSLGFKVPVIGYSFATRSTSDSRFGIYYLSTGLGYPFFTLGYRF